MWLGWRNLPKGTVDHLESKAQNQDSPHENVNCLNTRKFHMIPGIVGLGSDVELPLRYTASIGI
jgi:hypothetical protein